MSARRKRFIEERHAEILKLVKDQERVTVKELRDRFSVSISTVRGDLDDLERMGMIRRTHGGAIAGESDKSILPFRTRRMYYGAAKKAIGEAAASLINDGEVIFIDGGTTAAEMRRFLGGKQGLTIITPSVEVAYWLFATSPINVYLLNGFLDRDSFSTIGVPCLDAWQEKIIAKAFCGAAGFTLQDGLTDLHAGFVEQKRAICDHARSVIGLIDHSKVGVTSLASFAGLDDIDIIVTDRALPPEMMRAVEEHKISVIEA